MWSVKDTKVFFTGDMLVAMNDVDLTWLNIDDLLRQSSHQNKVFIFLLSVYISGCDQINYKYPRCNV